MGYKILLETSATDGLLLEDGSGNIVLENFVPTQIHTYGRNIIQADRPTYGAPIIKTGHTYGRESMRTTGPQYGQVIVKEDTIEYGQTTVIKEG